MFCGTAGLRRDVIAGTYNSILLALGTRRSALGGWALGPGPWALGLAALRTEQYGYTLRKALAEHDVVIDESTLYPLLRRLESQGLLVSEWREEDKRQKRFYRLSPDGRTMLKQLVVEWQTLESSLTGILKEPRRGHARSLLTGS